MAREVSSKLLSFYVDAARKRGASPEALVAGLSFTVAQLLRPPPRIDWELFCDVSERLEALCGGAQELERVGREFSNDPLMKGMNSVFGLLTSPRSIYWAAHRWFGPSMFSIVRSGFEDLPDGRIRMTLEIPESYRDSAQLFRINLGVFETNTRILGQPDAHVTMELGPRRATYIIDPPPSLTLWARLRRAFRVFVSSRTAIDELGAQQERLRERFDELRTAYGQIGAQTSQLQLVNQLGRELAELIDLQPLGEAVIQLLRGRFRATGVRLWVVRHEGEPEVVLREQGACEGPPARDLALTSAGSRIGRIHAWGSGDASVEGLAFEDLVPWVSIALGNARAVALLRDTQATLEQKVEARTAELAQSLERVQALDRQKTEFFAQASHELRTPLTLILAPLEAAALRTDVREDVREEIRGVLRGCYRLMKLINDILDLSKIEAGKMHLRIAQTDLSRILDAVARQWGTPLLRRKVKLTVEIPLQLPIAADGERLEQVALNLMSNAVRFVPDGGEVKLVASAPRAGEVEFSVENSGDGIDPRDLPHLFERFGQGSASKGRRFGSTGLGLPVVQELVTLHGGRIAVENEPGKRVCFRVTLPVHPAGNEPLVELPLAGPVELLQYQVTSVPDRVPALSALPEPSDRPVVLLAEDNTDLREFLARSLRTTYTVIEAVDGQDALERLEVVTPDLVLSDLMMPRLDGVGLCRALKERPSTAHTPFILLTARGDLDSKVLGLGTGADDYLVKPFHIEEVNARLRAQLRLRDLFRQVAQQEKLAALGMVVAGVAHEIGNPLNGILNSLRPLRELVAADQSEAIELIDLALDGAGRVERIAKQLLQQVRAGEGDPHEVDLEENVHLAVQLLSRKALQGPKIVSTFGAERPRVYGEPAALNQVWINLIDNAIHAAGPNGEVTVRMERCSDAVEVEVGDNGPGIEPHLLRKIFDPFFTTRPVGEGTGLGLHVVREIVKKHGGEIAVRSTPGQGASFKVKLPTVRAGQGESYVQR